MAEGADADSAAHATKPATAATAGPAARWTPRWASTRPDVSTLPATQPRPGPAAELRPEAIGRGRGLGESSLSPRINLGLRIAVAPW